MSFAIEGFFTGLVVYVTALFPRALHVLTYDLTFVSIGLILYRISGVQDREGTDSCEKQ